jgi:Rieske Fe-S protein
MSRATLLFAVTLLLALTASWAIGAYAATSVNASANTAWTGPVNDANGIPLAGSPNAVTSYKVYASTSPLSAVPATAPLATVTAPNTTTTGSVTANVGDTLYVYVTACNATGCSGLSVPGTKLVQAPGAAPGVPTSVTLTVTISVPGN